MQIIGASSIDIGQQYYVTDVGAEVLTALGDSYTLELIGGNYYKKYSSIIL